MKYSTLRTGVRVEFSQNCELLQNFCAAATIERNLVEYSENLLGLSRVEVSETHVESNLVEPDMESGRVESSLLFLD